MTITELLADLDKDGITVWAQDGALRYRAPHGALTDERRAALRARRDEILAHLDAEKAPVADPGARHEPFPLTDLQAAYLLGRGNVFPYGELACHAYVEVRYDDLDADALAAAWHALHERHPMLTAVVHPDGYQEIPQSVAPARVGVDDLRGQGSDAAHHAIGVTRDRLSHRAGDASGPPHRAHLTRTDDGDVLHLSVDLLTVDHQSLRHLLTELHTEATAAGSLPALPPATFRDHVLARRAATGSAAYERDRAYWTDRCATLPPAPELPLAEPWSDAEPADPPRFRRLEALLTPAEAAGLRTRAAARGLTPSAVLLTAYAETIGRWSRSARFTLNLPVSTRPLGSEHAAIVGEFTDIELLEADLTEELPFAERTQVLTARLLDDLEHRAFGGTEVLAELSRHTGSRALMPVVFTTALDDPADTPGEVVYALTQTPQVWLDCQVMRRGERLALSWDVREGVLAPGLADAAFDAFTALVRTLATTDTVWDVPADPPLPAGQRQARKSFGATAAPVPGGLLHHGVLAQVERTPDRVAVRARDLELTYGELRERATTLAARLVRAGAAPGDLVGVYLDKGWEQIVAVLAVHLAGGAYLPVDTAQPPARRDAILADAGVRLVVSRTDLAEAAPLSDAVTTVAVDAPTPGAPEFAAPADADPSAPAYVIYTSGSTGTPKGVVISHRAALNTVADINRRFRVGPEDRVLGVAGLGFDLSVYDIFGPLAVGGTLVLPGAERRGDPSHWAALIADEGVTVWNSVPGQLRMLLDWAGRDAATLRSLRLAMVSGDWVPVPLPREARDLIPELQVVALGGATEGAIWSIFHPADDIDERRPSVPYGRPLANQNILVVDTHLRLRPDWVAGELCIAGEGVADGYLGDPERTAERFVRHPLTGERLYRTGDMGRFLPDGTIEFLGRVDNQVKIRGYRIELAEVEAALGSHPDVGACAVVVDDDGSGTRRLAAFVEPGRVRPPEGEDAVAQAAELALREAGADPENGRQLTEFLAELDDVALGVMAHTLASAGLFEDDAAHDFDDICARLRATPRHRRLVARWLGALTAAGRLDEAADGRWRNLRGDGRAAGWGRAEELERRVDWGGELLATMRTCADRVAELLDGSLDVRALLFPGASSDMIASAYRDNLAVRRLTTGVVAAVRAAAAGHAGEQQLRVLEVGGGVGGTTEALVPALAEFGVDLLFTDPSAFFVAEARQRFADHPWVRYAQFDPDRAPDSQGLVPNSFEVVICANTLHATADTGAALARIRELLAPGGLLVLVENTRDAHPPLMVSLEFLELTVGAWTDVRAATGQSFLTRPQWLDALDRLGATGVRAWPPPEDPLAATGQELILARVKTDRARVETAALLRHAAARLPEYMVPASCHVVDALPLTGNGKVDRAALAARVPRDEVRPTGASAAPADAFEQQLADLWAELLGAGTVGRDDDFFALGGDSLLVARMVGSLREIVPHGADLEWEPVLREMLLRPTVAGLAAYLRTAGADTPADVRAAGEASPLVHLHGPPPGGDAVTVLVHAGTGTLMPYRSLITEARRRSRGGGTLMGLEVPDLERFLTASPERLIETIAADYTRALAATGAKSFHLIGYCLGGLIATEVARGLGEAGHDVATLTVISSHSPRFRLDDGLLAEYSFAVMMGIDPPRLGFPDDENAVAAAADAVLAGSPGVLRAGGLAELSGLHEPVAACFRALADVAPEQRVARMCDVVPAAAGTYAPDHMDRLFRTFRQSVFGITRYQPEPYAGDITFLRHSGAYPFPGSRDAVTAHWQDLALGDLRIVDIAGDHFTCLTTEHAPAVLRLIDELTGGEVTR